MCFKKLLARALLLRSKQSKKEKEEPIIIMMPRLPDVIVDDILSRLPVKSLLRFKSASKSWRSLIDSSYFVRLHLSRSNKSPSVLLTSEDCIIGAGSLDGFTTEESGNVICQSLKCEWDCSLIVRGSCNGLFCLSTPNDTVILWNPMTQQARQLPFFNFNVRTPRFCCEGSMYGFWYDSSSDDYKVVRFLLFCKVSLVKKYWYFHDEVGVYSFKSNSWHSITVKCLQNCPVQSRTGQVLIDCCLHWVSESEEGRIVAFDLSSKKFGVVTTPLTDHSLGGRIMLNDFGGCLSMLFYHDNEVDMWVMKEYAVEESWMKLVTITGYELGLDRGIAIPLLRSIACPKRGFGILYQLNSENFLWFDIERKTIKKITFRGAKRFFIAEVYTESLVSLDVDGGTQTQGVCKRILPSSGVQRKNCFSKFWRWSSKGARKR